LPHEPQWSWLVITSVQTPPHTLSGASQVQLPAAHTSRPEQLTPQAPQFVASLVTSRHDTEPSPAVQRMLGAGQVSTHDPSRHSSVVAQLTPHPPQLAASLVRSTHAAPQREVPLGHVVGPQPPAKHDSSASHALSQLPQCAPSVIGSTQAPPHSTRPESQGSSSHAPA
jgi:hypothetical protein